jgi:hypothetical protein
VQSATFSLKLAAYSAVVVTYPESIRSEAVADSSRRYVLHPTLAPTPIPELPPEDTSGVGAADRGRISHEFSYAAAGMLVFNLNLQWKRDPSKLPLLIKQIRTFFQKYQHLLAVMFKNCSARQGESCSPRLKK